MALLKQPAANQIDKQSYLQGSSILAPLVKQAPVLPLLREGLKIENQARVIKRFRKAKLSASNCHMI